ncbi:Diadenosine hexaphosphate hydrolase [compost metagenome]
MGFLLLFAERQGGRGLTARVTVGSSPATSPFLISFTNGLAYHGDLLLGVNMQEIHKKLSCGILIVDANKNILMLHATGQNFWDLPKGTQDEGESTMQTAIREVEEETGIVADPAQCIELGWYEYNRFKDVFLYLLPVEKVDIGQLRCKSTFFNNAGEELPEADSFDMIPLSQASSYMCASMARLYSSALERDILIMLDRFSKAA